MLNVMEEAASRNLEVIVLDRPNPDQRLPDRGLGPRSAGAVSFVGTLPDARASRA